MRVFGIDPSSTVCGVALVDGTFIRTWLWRKNDSQSQAWNLNNYFQWLQTLIANFDTVDVASIEFLSVSQNAITTRLISHFQAASALACKNSGLLVVEGRVSAARKAVIGKGNASKEETYGIIKEMFPDYQFESIKKGGGDQTDAVVMALAAPTLIERH